MNFPSIFFDKRTKPEDSISASNYHLYTPSPSHKTQTPTHLPYLNFTVSVRERGRESSSHINLMERDKKRDFPNFQEVEDDHPSQTNPKRTCTSFPTRSEAESAIVAELFSPESWSQIEAFLHRVVGEEVDSKFESHFHFLPSSLRSSQLNDQNEEATVDGSGKLKLCFLNQIASTIFTNNKIEVENGEPLQVALCDVTNFNAIVSMGPLSSAQIEFVVLDGGFGSSQRLEETHWTMSNFNRSVLSQRVGKRPLIVGNDLKLHLKNGVGFIKNLSFTDNSSWLKSKKFRLGARIIDQKILAKFPRIDEAVSQPFRVMDHRGEVNKKHHPPMGEDEVWRLEGIGKNGVYHNNLSSKGIETVDDFLKTYYEKDSLYLKKLLGKKVPNKTWKAMVNNALECVHVANFAPSFETQNLVGNEAMGSETLEGNEEVDEQMNSSDGNEFLEATLIGLDQQWEPMLNFEDLPLFPHEETSTSYSHNHEVRNAGTCNQ